MPWCTWTASRPRPSPTAPLAAGAVALGLFAVLLWPAGAAAAACEDWLATAVSVQGGVQARRANETQWVRAYLNDTYCAGDTLRVDARSRAAVLLRNGAVLRLDQNTTITFSTQTTKERSWVELLTGAVHFVSRVARGLNVLTPFVNAAVEGTEFWIEVGADEAVVTVFEGRVTASNAAGSLTLDSRQSAIARAGQAPTPRSVPVTPADAVQWALYYPPLVDYRPAEFPDRPGETWQPMVRKSLQSYADGDLEAAFASLTGVPANIADARFSVYRAALLLSVGRVDEAIADIERALTLDPGNGHVFALRSVIAVTQNDKAEALRLARRAVELDPRSATARVAFSYAQQADFDLKGALASLQSAVALQPDSGLVQARLAELWLSVRDLDKALAAASVAAGLNPNLARTHTVLGFAYLSQIDTRRAAEAFERAIRLDQADPLPRLGLGLARIRDGDPEGGRREIEVAVSLDPANSLLRSYLGKAYYEEKRASRAAGQFTIAQEQDPKDPTPPFYDAIRKQSINRPVEALQDLQRSIELNDNRAVYRSRLLLDEDLAARSASLARIYDDLGFQQLALLQGWRSLSVDPSNYSAHRFLADSYAVLPRHEIARVSEILQYQLWQPLNVDPVRPQLALSKSFILSGTGPANPSFNEFNALFERNRLSLLASGVAGGNSTYGDEVVVSGLWSRFSVSLGQLHYESRGFRANNDQNQDVYNVFAQVSLPYATSLLVEFRSTDFKRGDLPLRFDPANFFPALRQTDRIDSIRLGIRHALAAHSDLLASVSYQSADFDTTPAPGVGVARSDDGYTAEVLYSFRSEPFGLVGGAGYLNVDRETVNRFPFLSQTTGQHVRHTNLYVYSYLNYLRDLTVTLGGSVDFFDGIVERDQVNPKLGLSWNPLPDTTLRAAAFRVLKRPLISDQTIEPTQVAGFNQLFDDAEGTDAWRYGIGIDQKLPGGLYAGAEISRRDLTVPLVDITESGLTVRRDRWKEDVGRAYMYWTAHPWLALAAEYQYERFSRDPEARNPEQIARVRTHRIPLSINFFHPSGLAARLRATYVDQAGDFGNLTGDVARGADQFWVVDASLGYRLPKRWGLITIEAKNLFDRRFRFQDTNPANPVISPERLILVRFTLAY